MENEVLFNIKCVDIEKVHYDEIQPCFLCRRRCIGLFFVAGKIQKYMTICMHCQLLGGMGTTAEEAIKKWNRQVSGNPWTIKSRSWPIIMPAWSIT